MIQTKPGAILLCEAVSLDNASGMSETPMNINNTGVMAMIRAFDNSELGQKNGAILGLIGTVNVPIIYKSVDWWHTLHQPATLKVTTESSIHIDMLQPLLVMIAGFYLFYALAICLFLRAEILYHEQGTSWVKELCARRKKVRGVL